jgi:hypothetical protein
MPNNRSTWIIAIVVGIIVVLAIVRAVLGPNWRRIFSSIKISRWWVQGALLSGRLLIGMAVAGISFYYGPPLAKSKISKGGQLIEKYRKLNLREQTQHLELNVENYSRITVFTRTTAPENSSATVTILGFRDRGTNGEINRIESISSWSSWDQEDPNSNLRIVVEPLARAGTIPATEVDVLIYLTPK